MEMKPEIKKEWDDFLEFIYSSHQISRGLWFPDYYSIRLWEEFKESKKKEK